MIIKALNKSPCKAGLVNMDILLLDITPLVCARWSGTLGYDETTRYLGNWNQLTTSDPRVNNSKRLTYHQWCALPIRDAHAIHPPYTMPAHMYLDLPHHVLRNTTKFRLQTFQSPGWQSNALTEALFPLQPLVLLVYVTRTAVKMYNRCMCLDGLLNSNSEELRTVLDADLQLHSRDFTDDLRHRLCSVWRGVEGVDQRETNNTLETHCGGTRHCLLCLLTAMSANQPGYLGTCIWIRPNMSCKMSADSG
eukprot:1156319-Pelagomonas_calceolata.AAC.2